MKSIHYICGLPRAGSTLLANILAQNPDVHTTPTSGCHDVLFGIKNNWNKLIEHQASKELADTANLKRVLSATLNTYHDTDRPIIIDKGRGWTSMLEMLEWVTDEEAKVLVPVRSIPQILSSLEKLHRKRVATGQQDGDYINGQTVEGRTSQQLLNSSVLGLAFDRLKDAMHRGYGDRLHFVEFDDLTHNPKHKMEEVYSFLGLAPFNHNFQSVEQYTHEDDSVHGGLDLHTIRKEVRPVQDDSAAILGAEIVTQYSGAEFWRSNPNQK